MSARELLAELQRVIAAGLPCCWCTLVATRGSTPQKAGAAMLVYLDGSQAGTLGGGCVEAEVKRRALRALADGTGPAFHTFVLDADHGWDDGLICGGRMTALVDPAGPAAAEYVRQLRSLAEAGTGLTEVIALPDNAANQSAGSRFLFDPGGRPVASLRAPLAAAPPLSGSPKSQPRDGLAFLRAAPRVRLLVVGGGHVGRAVAKLAAEVEFDVWVLDDREPFVSAERFPSAARRLVGDIGRTLRELAPGITPATYALIVTRGHNRDEEALYHLAPTAAGYVGMIGSRRKVRLIFDDLRAKGVSDEALARVRAPVGLPIGSQTVPEIAVSIVAGLIARRNLGPGAEQPPDG